MTKHSLALYILIFVLITALAVVFILTDGVVFSNPALFSSFKILSQSQSVTVYVCGAVQNSGYYTCQVGDTLYSLVQQAGILSQSYLDNQLYTTYVSQQSMIVVDFVCEGERQHCVNVNTSLTTLFDALFTLEQVEKLLFAQSQLGTIKNILELRPYLGEDFDLMYFKLYVDEVDYETY